MERGARESKVEQSKEADDGDALLLKYRWVCVGMILPDKNVGFVWLFRLDFPNGCRYALRLSSKTICLSPEAPVVC